MSSSTLLAPMRNKSGASHFSAQLLFHDRQVFERLLGGADAARGFESDGGAGFFRVLANSSRHHQGGRQGGVHRFLSGGSLDEVGAGHHGDEAGAGDVVEIVQIASTEDDFHQFVPARCSKRRDLVIKRLPSPLHGVFALDDHIDFIGAGLDGAMNLRDALFHGREALGKIRGHRGDLDSRAVEFVQGRFYERVIDADRGDL